MKRRRAAGTTAPKARSVHPSVSGSTAAVSASAVLFTGAVPHCRLAARMLASWTPCLMSTKTRAAIRTSSGQRVRKGGDGDAVPSLQGAQLLPQSLQEWRSCARISRWTRRTAASCFWPGRCDPLAYKGSASTRAALRVLPHTHRHPPKPLFPTCQMGAQKMGFFTRAEFKGGLAELGVTTLVQLRKLLPTLSSELASPHAQEEFHKFAFNFCLTV